MKTQYYTATSIDGFIADPDNSLDWLFQFGEVEGMEDHYPDFLAGVGALAMGSTTYQWIFDYENADPAKAPTWPYQLPTWVFTSRTLPTIEGANVTFVNGDVRPVHAAMNEAAAGKNIWLVGGGELVGQFLDADLLDELILGVAPVLLGAGAPLLPRTLTTPPLKLIDATSYGEVFAMLTYQVRRPAQKS